MNGEEAEHVLSELGSSRFSVSGSGWLRATCPFARWKHAKGQDLKPSFAISIAPGNVSHFKCLSCGMKGDMLQFAWKLETMSARKHPELVAFIQRTNTVSLASIRETLAKSTYAAPPPRDVAGIQLSARESKFVGELPLMDESVLDAYVRPEGPVLEYLINKRGLTEHTIGAWDLLWHPNSRRIGIPIRDCQGRLVAVSGRAFSDSQHPKYMHSKGFHRDYYLYGEHLLTEQPGQVGILVEGFFDVIKLWQFGYDNAVAMFGSYLSKIQLEKLVKFFSRLIVVPDGDVPGYEAADRIKEQVTPRMRCRVTPTPPGYDPGDFTLEMAEALLGPAPGRIQRTGT